MRLRVVHANALRRVRPLACRVVSLAIGLSLLLSPWLVSARHAHAQEAKLRIEVGDNGFNGNPGDFTIDVNQGQVVELTFVWAHQVHVHDEHVMVLSGYKLESEKLSTDQREVTMKFVADQAGTFDFKCDLDCEAHDVLQRGRLRVKAGGGGGSSSAGRTPTVLTLKVLPTDVSGGPAVLQAILRDDKGTPVAKAAIQFAIDSEFGGTKGRVAIGTARTDANGVAFLDYLPRREGAAQAITARFEGQGMYGESEQSGQIEVRAATPAYHMESIGLESIRDWAPAALAAVVIGVWAVFGIALYQVYGVARVRRRP